MHSTDSKRKWVAFGARIRDARIALMALNGGATKSNPYSLRSVARLCGMSAPYLSNIEQGKIPPPSSTYIMKLSACLSIDYDELLALSHRIEHDLLMEIRSNTKVCEIVDFVMQATEDERAGLVITCRYLRKFENGLDLLMSKLNSVRRRGVKPGENTETKRLLRRIGNSETQKCPPSPKG